MKKIATDERYEERGSPICWMWLFVAALWGMNALLRISDGETGWGLVACGLLTAASVLCAIEWARYRLVVDAQGVFQQQGWAKTTLSWADIDRVMVHNKVSFWKSTGLTFHPADRKKRSLYINRVEMLPLVQKYAVCPVEENQ